MRFMAHLFLAALAGAMVCAEDATSEPIEAAPAQDPTGAQLQGTTPVKSASLQETDTVAPKPWAVASIFSPKPELNALKAFVDKSFLLLQKAFEEAEKRVNERIQGGKQIAGNGAGFLQGLKKNLNPSNWF